MEIHTKFNSIKELIDYPMKIAAKMIINFFEKAEFIILEVAYETLVIPSTFAVL